MQLPWNSKVKYSILAASLFVCSPLWASETYPEHLWYIGGGLGAADSGLYKLPESIDTYTAYDKSGQAGKLFFGKHISENVDVEVFYANLGRSFSQGTSGWYGNSKSNSYGIAAKYFLLSGVFRPYAKVGIHRLTSKESAHSDMGTDTNIKSKSTNILYGVGLDYSLNKSDRVALEYETYGKVGTTDIDSTTETGQLKPKALFLSFTHSY